MKNSFLYGKMKTKLNFPLTLIGRRHLRSNNSWMHNINRLVKGKDRCTLLINEKDAEKLNIKHSQKVKVISNVGSVIISVEISNEMMQGVVSIPHGWGHHYKNTQMEIAQQNAGS